MNVNKRQVVAEALLKRRIKNMIRLDDKAYTDSSYITNTEYQLFLDQMTAHGEFYQPDYWIDFQYDPGTGLETASGIRHSDAHSFCEWLTQKEGGLWHFRFLENSDEIKSILNLTDIDFPGKFYREDTTDLALASAVERALNHIDAYEKIHNVDHISESYRFHAWDLVTKLLSKNNTKYVSNMTSIYDLQPNILYELNGIPTVAIELALEINLNIAVSIAVALKHNLQFSIDHVLESIIDKQLKSMVSDTQGLATAMESLNYYLRACKIADECNVESKVLLDSDRDRAHNLDPIQVDNLVRKTYFLVVSKAFVVFGVVIFQYIYFLLKNIANSNEISQKIENKIQQLEYLLNQLDEIHTHIHGITKPNGVILLIRERVDEQERYEEPQRTFT